MTRNYLRITEGFQILDTVLAPYVARELRAQFRDAWWRVGVFAKPGAWAELAPHHRGLLPSPGHQRPAVRAACGRGLEPRREARPGRSPRLETVDRLLIFIGTEPVGPAFNREVDTFLEATGTNRSGRGPRATPRS